MPPGDEGQVSQVGPQEVGESARHSLPQRLKPNAQVNPQLPEAQVAVEFAGGVQGVHALPQLVIALSLTQVLPQAWKPALQLSPHATPSQVATPLVLVGQAEQLVPQEDTLVSGRHWLPHAWNPALQVKPQLVPLQVAVPLRGGVHGVQALPQLLMLSLGAQALPQAWKPGLQEVPQVPCAVQNELPPGTVGHGAHAAPHEAAEFATHWSLQRLKPVAQVKPQLPPLQVVVELAGPVAQGEHELPQLAMELLLTH